MEQLAKPANLLDKISEFQPFQDIDAAALQWIIDKADYIKYEEGEALFYDNKPVNHMQIIVDGEYTIKLKRQNETKIMGTGESGMVTGVLPFSRMKVARAWGIATKPTYTLELHKEHFTEMVNISYELVQNLVGLMSNRIREFTHLRFQDEKLMSLGKLSAGLAHELNNPASAMVRSADLLYQQVHTTPEKFKKVMTMKITDAQVDKINEILYAKAANWQEVELSLLEREDRMDDMLDWLEDHDIENAEDIAETFVDFDLTVEDVEKMYAITDGEYAGSIFSWVQSTLNLEQLVHEIKESADRISTLIKSIKSYSHMDRGVDFELVDIHEGIKNTLTMLKHKIKKKGIIIQKEADYSLPKIMAFPSELNQIWTNVIDNAIDAMEPGGTLTLRSYQKKHNICIEINDTGKGIPEEVKLRIFDPFFTTKPMGEGTGLGLDIVQRIVRHHKGDVFVESEPGNTTFTFCFPIKQ